MSVLGKTIRPMSNSGAHLVRKPIPTYPHNKLILTDEDGTGVATTLGDGLAVLLKGHGAATVGTTMQQSVTGMLHLEEQAIPQHLRRGHLRPRAPVHVGRNPRRVTLPAQLRPAPPLQDQLRPEPPHAKRLLEYHRDQAERSLKKQLKKGKKK
jgi:hypothetical protein